MIGVNGNSEDAWQSLLTDNCDQQDYPTTVPRHSNFDIALQLGKDAWDEMWVRKKKKKKKGGKKKRRKTLISTIRLMSIDARLMHVQDNSFQPPSSGAYDSCGLLSAPVVSPLISGQKPEDEAICITICGTCNTTDRIINGAKTRHPNISLTGYDENRFERTKRCQ